MSPIFQEQDINEDTLDGCSFLNYKLKTTYIMDSVLEYTLVKTDSSKKDSSKQDFYVPDTVTVKKTTKLILDNTVFVSNHFYDENISVRVFVPSNFFYIISR